MGYDEPELFFISFHHQTTTLFPEDTQYVRCSLSHFIIKPQPWGVSKKQYLVVLYLISSSNHNSEHFPSPLVRVVLYLISSSNHNIHTYVF